MPVVSDVIDFTKYLFEKKAKASLEIVSDDVRVLLHEPPCDVMARSLGGGEVPLSIREMLKKIRPLMVSATKGEKQGGGLWETFSHSLEVASFDIPVWSCP
jgi:hypothetical protein